MKLSPPAASGKFNDHYLVIFLLQTYRLHLCEIIAVVWDCHAVEIFCQSAGGIVRQLVAVLLYRTVGQLLLRDIVPPLNQELTEVGNALVGLAGKGVIYPGDEIGHSDTGAAHAVGTADKSDDGAVQLLYRPAEGNDAVNLEEHTGTGHDLWMLADDELGLPADKISGFGLKLWEPVFYFTILFAAAGELGDFFNLFQIFIGVMVYGQSRHMSKYPLTGVNSHAVVVRKKIVGSWIKVRDKQQIPEVNGAGNIAVSQFGLQETDGSGWGKKLRQRKLDENHLRTFAGDIYS